MAGLSTAGRDLYGVYPLRGKLLNVRDATTAQVTQNEEIQNIMKILGLELNKEYENVNSLRYGKIMIMTDRDHEGSHVKGLFINLIHYYWPTLLKIPSFLVDFITPVVKATHNIEGVQLFYSMPEYESWKGSLKSNATRWTIKYYKGLGSCESKEVKKYFSNLGSHQRKFLWEDEKDGVAIQRAFSKKYKMMTEDKKNWISSIVLGTRLDKMEPKITYSDFVNKEVALFIIEDLQRSIPSMVDGLKIGQRKILFCAFKSHLVKEAKVAKFAGSVLEKSAYPYGEQSLHRIIIDMARDYVGTNNINLLQPCGHFGSRISGGNAASATQISTKLSRVTRVLFPEDDDDLLTYLNEDGQWLEPNWYMPIIPFVLVNGVDGVGTGWNTFIPSYNPREIVANIRRLLNSESFVPMDPWYRGFKGTIEKTVKVDCTNYTVTGLCEKVNDTTLHISELPIGKWTDQYKKMHSEKKFVEEIRDLSDDTSVDMYLIMTEEKMREAEIDFQKNLKLTKTVSTSHMNLFDEKGVLKRYATPEDILTEFFHLRLRYYQRRLNTLKNPDTARSLWLKDVDALDTLLGKLDMDMDDAPVEKERREAHLIAQRVEEEDWAEEEGGSAILVLFAGASRVEGEDALSRKRA